VAGRAGAVRTLKDAVQTLHPVAGGGRDLGEDRGAVLHTEADAAGDLDRHANADSTIARAHQHAAAARKGG
jgi:hypothetical protein